MAELDIGESKALANQKGVRLKPGVGDHEFLFQRGNGMPDSTVVAFFCWRAHGPPEHGAGEAQRDVDF